MLQIFYELTPNVYSEMQTVRFADWAVGTACAVGEFDAGRMPFDDPAGSLDIKGWRKIRVYETLADPPLLWSGRIMNKDVKRGDSERASLRTGADRWWDCDAVDQNVLLSARVFHTSSANRPEETAGERLTWLLGTTALLPTDQGHVTYPTYRMDACDYTLQTPNDVLADCAAEGGYNWFAIQLDDSSLPELFFMLPGSSDWVSAARLSDIATDIDSTTTFAMSYSETTFSRKNEIVASGVALPYNGNATNSYVYVSDSDIGDEFAFVDRVAPMANVKSSSKATPIAERHLDASSTEADGIVTAIEIGPQYVADIRPFHLIQVRSSWMPGLNDGDWHWMRVVRWGLSQLKSGNYKLALELSPVEPDVVLETVTISICNTVLEDSGRNAQDTSSSVSFAAGQVWRYTITNTQHSAGSWTDDLALEYATTSPPSATTVVRAWGVTTHYTGPGTPTPDPTVGSGPTWAAFAVQTGTFVMTETGTGDFTLYAAQNYVSATVDECWVAVLERIG